jgi:hypothetical protein
MTPAQRASREELVLWPRSTWRARGRPAIELTSSAKPALRTSAVLGRTERVVAAVPPAPRRGDRGEQEVALATPAAKARPSSGRSPPLTRMPAAREEPEKESAAAARRR